jgi:glycosyltransferase involved in cell wall biosynthesis
LRTHAPRFSVVIPAHDEQNVIERCLAFVDDLEPGEAEVVVVANGCTDDTASRARAVPGVRVVELPRPGKAEALNSGDAVATAFPRIYLDADVTCDVDALRSVGDVLAGTRPLVCAPTVDLRTDGRPWSVRRFYDIYRRLPYVNDGLVGLGFYGLSETGRARFPGFPDLCADDLFVQQLFGQDERVVIDRHQFVVETPRTLRDLIRVRVRVARSNRTLTAASDVHDTSTGSTLRALLGLVRRQIRLAPAVVVYVAVIITARALARLDTGARWHRDSSTR